MNYEQKYKAALEWMRSVYDGLHGATKEDAEHYFPELQEDNDERIRKALKRGLSHFTTFGGIKAEDILAWLEKQEEPKDKGEISDGYHTFNELYEYRKLYNAAFFNLLPKELVHKSKKHHDGEKCFGGGWFIVMANLPTGQISNHYELKDWDLFQIPEKEVADEWDGHTPQEAAERLHKYLLEKRGESKPANKVEPKFHKGDWIIHQGTENIYQIVTHIDNQYQLKYGDNYTVQKCADVDRCARLWTIADAKDGDVLVDSYSKDSIIILYKRIDKERSILAHCGWNGYNLSIKTNGLGYGGLDNTDYLPATKEQRDLLFAKMKRSGL